MIKLNKSPLPNGVKIQREQDFRNDPIFSIIKNDCYNKCYICEDKEPTGLQVDHRIAPQGNDDLKYSWNNLLLTCYHCNHTKSDKYNSILDCTQVDPEDYIAISMLPYDKQPVKISILLYSDESKETAALLEIIYNGVKTTILNAECENLRSRVLKELNDFQEKLERYHDEPDLNIKHGFQRSIVKMIARSSAFAAFKRNTIRRHPAYFQEFGKYLA